MEKFWLASYPPGVPETIDLNDYRSLGDLFERCTANFADKVAFANMGKAITYRELEHLSRVFAAFLQVELKLAPGARVALMMPNLLQYPVALFGALRAGYAVVSSNPLYTRRELRATA